MALLVVLPLVVPPVVTLGDIVVLVEIFTLFWTNAEGSARSTALVLIMVFAAPKVPVAENEIWGRKGC